MPRQKRKRPKDHWLLSEAAPFIRRILNRRATDADRTAVARELADWLEARGDRMGYVPWFRHPALRWEHHDYGVSWGVHPWSNNGHGCSARIDVYWWAAHYPTPEYVASKHAEEITLAWLRNGVEVETYPWTREAAARLGQLATYDSAVAARARRREDARLLAIEEEKRAREQYRELRRRFSVFAFEDGGGI